MSHSSCTWLDHVHCQHVCPGGTGAAVELVCTYKGRYGSGMPFSTATMRAHGHNFKSLNGFYAVYTQLE